MNRLKVYFSAAAGELKSVRTLTLASFLTAIYAVSYSPVAGNFVIVPGLIEFRFGFLAIAVAAMMFGPIVGMLVAVLGDLLGTVLFYGGGFFIWYTVTWALMGFGFGCFLYKMRITAPRMLGAMLFNTCIISQLLTPLIQSWMQMGPFPALFVSRIIRTLVMFTVNTILLFLVLRGVTSVYGRISRTGTASLK